jgi:hypothetical protein
MEKAARLDSIFEKLNAGNGNEIRLCKGPSCEYFGRQKSHQRLQTGTEGVCKYNSKFTDVIVGSSLCLNSKER